MEMLVFSVAIWNIGTMGIWCTLWTFGNLVAIWYVFPTFWYIMSRKNWQP
jgi:hypothetical protein